MSSLNKESFINIFFSYFPIGLLFLSVFNDFDFNYLKIDYFAFNFAHILIFFWTNQNIMQSSGSRVASLQALKQQLTSRPATSQGLKLQAKILKRKYPRSRVQAIVPKLRVTSNKHIGILWVFHVE